MQQPKRTSSPGPSDGILRGRNSVPAASRVCLRRVNHPLGSPSRSSAVFGDVGLLCVYMYIYRPVVVAGSSYVISGESRATAVAARKRWKLPVCTGKQPRQGPDSSSTASVSSSSSSLSLSLSFARRCLSLFLALSLFFLLSTSQKMTKHVTCLAPKRGVKSKKKYKKKDTKRMDIKEK